MIFEGCKPGQQRFEESCYAFLNDLADHQQAEKRCQNDGSHLVSIGSEKEMKFLFSKLIFLASIIPGTDFKVHIGIIQFMFFTVKIKIMILSGYELHHIIDII